MEIPPGVVVILAASLEAMTTPIPSERIQELAAPIAKELDKEYETVLPMGSRNAQTLTPSFFKKMKFNAP